MSMAAGGGGEGDRPSAPPAGQFIYGTNSYANAVARAKNPNSLSIRQQYVDCSGPLPSAPYSPSPFLLLLPRAMAELTRNEAATNLRNRTISAGVSGACVTPKAGLSRTLPPLQSMRVVEHNVGMGVDQRAQDMVPMLPLRHIASAPTAVLQPILDQAKLLKPLGAGGGGGGGEGAEAVHDATREDRKRRKARRREKERERERRQREEEAGGAGGAY